MKKAWEKPQLLVLARSKPEEAVLLACKSSSISGLNDTHMQCLTLACTISVDISVS